MIIILNVNIVVFHKQNCCVVDLSHDFVIDHVLMHGNINKAHAEHT